MHPDAWISATTDALVHLVDDPHVSREDLRQVAIDLAEDRRYNVLSPAEAAALHVRETA